MVSPPPSDASPTSTPTFGVVAEGPTDFLILRFALAGYFDDSDISVRQIQPKPGIPGGWLEVLRFIGSDEFLPAFGYSDFLVIHVDTDCCEDFHFGVSKRDGDGIDLGVPELISAVRTRLISAVGVDRFATVAHRVLFAIAVHTTECWLLPLYWNDTRKEKTVNCVRSLNEQLVKQGFSIDVENKDVRYYRQIAKPLSKRKLLRLKAPHNPSFDLLIKSLDETFQKPQG